MYKDFLLKNDFRKIGFSNSVLSFFVRLMEVSFLIFFFFRLMVERHPIDYSVIFCYMLHEHSILVVDAAESFQVMWFLLFVTDLYDFIALVLDVRRTFHAENSRLHLLESICNY